VGLGGVSTIQPQQPREAQTPPSPEELERRRILSSRLFFGAGGLIAVSAFMPWVTALAIIQAHLTGGYILAVLVVGAAYAGAGYRVHQRRVTLTLLNGIWVLNALMAIGVILIFDAVGGLGNELVSPAAGVFAAGIGVITGVAATVQLHRSGAPVPHLLARVATGLQRKMQERQTATITTPPPGAQLSPDGHWWWDGNSWREVSQQSRPIETIQSSPSPPHKDGPATKPPGLTPPNQLPEVFCQDCGRSMDPNQRFCPACGFKQAEIG
jgi:hypothetical protein